MESENKINLDILLNLGAKMHPHLGMDNHTNKLIKTLFDNPSALSLDDAFDLGKYYQRMLDMIRTDGTELSAVLAMKHKLSNESVVRTYRFG
jgi:hypothetical protein